MAKNIDNMTLHEICEEIGRLTRKGSAITLSEARRLQELKWAKRTMKSSLQ